MAIEVQSPILSDDAAVLGRGLRNRALKDVFLFFDANANIEGIALKGFYKNNFYSKKDTVIGSPSNIFLISSLDQFIKKPANFLIEFLPTSNNMLEDEYCEIPIYDLTSGCAPNENIQNHEAFISNELAHIEQDDYLGLNLHDLHFIGKHDIPVERHHTALDTLLDYVQSLWLDSDNFSQKHTNNILFIVFIVLSKQINFNFNNDKLGSLMRWFKINELVWFEVKYNDLNAESREVYLALLEYALLLGSHVALSLTNPKLEKNFLLPPKEIMDVILINQGDSAEVHEELVNYSDDDVFSVELQTTTKAKGNNQGDIKDDPSSISGYNQLNTDMGLSDQVMKVIEPNIQADQRKKELVTLQDQIDSGLKDAALISEHQAWAIICDQWAFLNKMTKSKFIVDRSKMAITDQLMSLKEQLFNNWSDITSGNGQNKFIDNIAFETFKIEFLTHESKQILPMLKQSLSKVLKIEIESKAPKYLNETGLFNPTITYQSIDEIENENTKVKAIGILDSSIKEIQNTINSFLSNDSNLKNYFFNCDKELDQPTLHLIDNFFRLAIFSTVYSSQSKLSLKDMKSIIENTWQPDIQNNAYNEFELRRYQLQLVNDLSATFKKRFSSKEILSLDQKKPQQVRF